MQPLTPYERQAVADTFKKAKAIFEGIGYSLAFVGCERLHDAVLSEKFIGHLDFVAQLTTTKAAHSSDQGCGAVRYNDCCISI